MATVNKDFKIKSGLVVEGANGTIGGHNILTESTSGDQYILNLIGGETLVKSVSNEFDVSVAGELSIDRATVDAYYDAAGDAADAEQAAKSYADGLASNYDPAGSATTAENNAKSYADGLASNYDPAGSATTAENNAKSYADGLASNYDPAGSASTAQSNAENYADAKISDANGTATDKAWSAYKTSTEIGLAQAAAELHADNAVAALVDSAPALLDTLNELAAAIGDDANFASSIGTSIGEKVAKSGDTMTGELVLSADPTQALAAATKQYVDAQASDAYNDAILTASGDATTKANAAEQNAKDYADALTTSDIAEGTNLYFTNQRAIDAVGGTIGDAINLLDTDDIEEGSTNLYFTDGRAKTSAADLLTGATLSNITITGNGSGLTITAENGVAGSTTTDLAEGSNLYFTDARALDAISGSNIQPQSIDITWVRREEATWTDVATASKATCHSASTSEGSMKYLVRVTASVGGTRHSHVTEVLATVDGANGVAVVEYGTIYTSADPLATVTVEWNASTSKYDLNVTTANNSSEVMVAATLMATLD